MSRPAVLTPKAEEVQIHNQFLRHSMDSGERPNMQLDWISLKRLSAQGACPFVRIGHLSPALILLGSLLLCEPALASSCDRPGNTWHGASADDLARCIEEIRKNIADLQKTPVVTGSSILSAGIVLNDGNWGRHTGPSKIDTVLLNNNEFHLSGVGGTPLPDNAVLLVGPTKNNMHTNIETEGKPHQNQFTVSTFVDQKPFPTEFWYLILSGEGN
jgi:hypothetical protein